MDQSKILIIGCNGQLGKALVGFYPNAQRADSQDLDISDESAVANYNWKNVSIILNAAAYTNVDGAETEDGRRAAWSINASGVVALSRAAIAHDITVVHISTDYVFDGTNKIHTETEKFSPLSVYGQSKAAGDLAVSLIPKHYILRTSWVIGDGNNFVRTMINLGKKGVSPTVVADQVGRLTFTNELVRAADHLLSNKSPYGTYNVSNSGEPTSWADLTRRIFRICNYNLNVTDTTTNEYFKNKPEAAPRPLQSTFDLSKITATGFSSHDWQTDLDNYVKEELSK